MNKPKCIGILAITAEGASLCYREIVSKSSEVLGNNIHPEIVLHNHPFAEIAEIQLRKDWDGLANLLASSANKLIEAGAEFIIMPANSSHYAIEKLRDRVSKPVLSIVEITIQEAVERGYKKLGVFGIGMTMTDGLYEKPLQKAGIEAFIPSRDQQRIINRVIFENIIPNKATKESTDEILEIISDLKNSGCDAVGLCCTELPIIITNTNSPLPIIDTTRLLAHKALEYSIL